MKNLFYLFTTIFISTISFAQGCSDAGICTIGHGFDSNEKVLKIILKLELFLVLVKLMLLIFHLIYHIQENSMKNFRLAQKLLFHLQMVNLVQSSFGDAFNWELYI